MDPGPVVKPHRSAISLLLLNRKAERSRPWLASSLRYTAEGGDNLDPREIDLASHASRSASGPLGGVPGPGGRANAHGPGAGCSYTDHACSYSHDGGYADYGRGNSHDGCCYSDHGASHADGGGHGYTAACHSHRSPGRSHADRGGRGDPAESNAGGGRHRDEGGRGNTGYSSCRGGTGELHHVGMPRRWRTRCGSAGRDRNARQPPGARQQHLPGLPQAGLALSTGSDLRLPSAAG